MLPLSTHLFSHWSIPLNQGVLFRIPSFFSSAQCHIFHFTSLQGGLDHVDLKLNWAWVRKKWMLHLYIPTNLTQIRTILLGNGAWVASIEKNINGFQSIWLLWLVYSIHGVPVTLVSVICLLYLRGASHFGFCDLFTLFTGCRSHWFLWYVCSIYLQCASHFGLFYLRGASHFGF